MKKNYLLNTSLIVLLIMTMSFKSKVSSEQVAGIYSVCNSESSPKFEVTLNKDFTFHYFNSYDPAKIIDVKGTWTFDNNQILLRDYLSENKIHDKWHVDKTEKCIKSRLGLEWTRLCNVSEIK